MMKNLIMLVLCVGGLAAAVRGASPAMEGLPTDINGDRALKLMIGTADHEELACGSANDTASFQNCRAIYADVGGIVKIDYMDGSGNKKTEVITLNDATFYPIRNVTVAYRYYTGTTATTCKIYDASGSLVTGIKIRR